MNNFTIEELQIITDLNSQQFGFLDLERNEELRLLVVRTIKVLKCIVVSYDKDNLEKRKSQNSLKIKTEIDAEQSKECDQENNADMRNKSQVDSETYCKLGHLHLLLEEYEKALSAYKTFFSLKSKYWKNVDFLYGLGLVYFHFNAFRLSSRAFKELLYLNPHYPRANEAHLRLGFMHKTLGEYQSSLKHYNFALMDVSACTFTKLQIRFHIGHLYEIQCKYSLAKEAYEKLLTEQEITMDLKAIIYRHLGWMYHCCDYFGDKKQRETYAILCLQKSIEANPKSGQSLYLLGRCYAGINKVHDAFIAYRNSVEKSEGNADTWCSIGVLYQQQNQPTDALQAYICAVQLDKNHKAAWTNLGILYESCGQPKDAFACYLNAVRSSEKESKLNSWNSGEYTKFTLPHTTQEISIGVEQRLEYLESQLLHAPIPSITSKRRQLCSIEEAWNLPISLEMSSRQQQQNIQQTSQVTPQRQMGKSSTNGLPPPYPSNIPASAVN